MYTFQLSAEGIRRIRRRTLLISTGLFGIVVALSAGGTLLNLRPGADLVQTLVPILLTIVLVAVILGSQVRSALQRLSSSTIELKPDSITITQSKRPSFQLQRHEVTAIIEHPQVLVLQSSGHPPMGINHAVENYALLRTELERWQPIVQATPAVPKLGHVLRHGGLEAILIVLLLGTVLLVRLPSNIKLVLGALPGLLMLEIAVRVGRRHLSAQLKKLFLVAVLILFALIVLVLLVALLTP